MSRSHRSQQLDSEQLYPGLRHWAEAHAPLWYLQAMQVLELLKEREQLIARIKELEKPKDEP